MILQLHDESQRSGQRVLSVLKPCLGSEDDRSLPAVTFLMVFIKVRKKEGCFPTQRVITNGSGSSRSAVDCPPTLQHGAFNAECIRSYRILTSQGREIYS